ncbi:MAG TPA: sigma-70 family RNA polymerase sigma factor [Solirubrobacteraceae bacterium]|jgi:RNA polymerase sigma-70 factor (ECF subfamily)
MGRVIVVGAPDLVRREADRIETAARSRRFRSRRDLDGSDAADGLLAAAVARARAGDEHAVRFLFLRCSDSVYGYVRSIVHDDHEAEDLTQLIFAKLIAALPRYEPSIPFPAWIMRVAHNAAVDHLRGARAVPVAEVRSAEQQDHDLSRERGHDLRAALDELPRSQRDVIVLRFVLGLSPEETAERLGRSVLSVHSLQARARRALRAELTRTHAAPAVRAAA